MMVGIYFYRTGEPLRLIVPRREMPHGFDTVDHFSGSPLEHTH